MKITHNMGKKKHFMISYLLFCEMSGALVRINELFAFLMTNKCNGVIGDYGGGGVGAPLYFILNWNQQW